MYGSYLEITERCNLDLYNVSSRIPFSTPEIKRESMYGWWFNWKVAVAQKKNDFSMLKWRTINYKMKAPPASSRTPRNCIGKQTRSGGGEGRGGEGGGKEREICSYVDSICAVLPIRHGYWIGLDRRVSNTNTRSLDVGRPLPFLFQTEITLSRPTPSYPEAPPPSI